MSIVSDKGTQLTSTFWERFQSELGSIFDLSVTFHPQTDGQLEWTIQVILDMLWACIMYFKDQWHRYLT